MEYCVAIRTLGTAGEKYQSLLDSLNRQTIKPKRVFVYIPFGYEIPKETIGWEEYIRCPKGMITQRSLSFDEIDTDFILFCDDDLWFADDFVEMMFKGLQENEGDCIAPDVFRIHELSRIGRVKKAIASYTFPRKDDGWAFRIMRNASYTYNVSPSRNVLPTESAAGACLLIKKKVYLAIHFEDERWMEDFGYPLGEDTLFFYKLNLMGYKVLIHYSSDFKHLDAKAGSNSVKPDWIMKNVALSLVVPYRLFYNLKTISKREKFICLLSCMFMLFEQFLFIVLKMLFTQKKFVGIDFVRGIIYAYKYINSQSYKSIPKFDYYSQGHD